MLQSIYVFNAEHDLALANNDPNFNAPLSALQLVRDLECLPVWYAKPPASVLCRSGCSVEWLNGLKELFPALADIHFLLSPENKEPESVNTWGWDKAVCKYLSTSFYGTHQDNIKVPKLVPTEEQLDKIRTLSHRRIALNAFRYLSEYIPALNAPMHPAVEISTIEELHEFVNTNAPVVLKAPWSGSGKGLCWVKRRLNKSQLGWCANVINKQGSLIAEKVYPVLQDFAMLFSCKNGKTDFEGYSLFETETGIYRSNQLLSNEAILKQLYARGISPELPELVQFHLRQFIDREIAPFYSGLLGIDMFVFRHENQTGLHPCVEINLRTTMGYVARVFYDRFVCPGAKGSFSVDYFPQKDELWLDHSEKKKQNPVVLNAGKLKSGYMSLTTVYPHSNYRIRVEVS